MAVKRYASIDVGTNTVRLLIGEPDPEQGYRVLFRDRAITRLGGNFSDDVGLIDRAAADRTIQALRSFSKSLLRFQVDNVKAVGTSVCRRAHNRDEFINEVLSQTGLKIDVLTGNDEALLTFKGVLQVIGNDGAFVIMDIGGGSTEYVLGCNGEEIGVYSIEMGVVSLTEAFLRSDPSTPDELAKLEEEIEMTLSHLMSRMKKNGIDLATFSDVNHARLVGTAGTPTTLAAIDQNMEEYKPEMINGYSLPQERLREMYHYLSQLTLRERINIPSLEKGREDVILAGIAIILKTMELLGFKGLIVSDSGLLEGALLDVLGEGDSQPKKIGIQ
jgi:exopolyphosphatase/guanosine-5'-triphosphate,3'-diphosphate pyrophosphatase